MRLFIAVNFSENIKDVIYDASKKLKSHCVSGNFSHRDNLHLTLLFIGEVSPKTAAKIKNVIGDMDFGSVKTSIVGFGKFKRRNENIYWLGLKDDGKLAALAKNVKKALRGIIDTEDEKGFSPHITIARRAVPKPEFDEKEFAEGIPKADFSIDRISLMRSDRLNGRLAYTEIYGKNAAREKN